MRSLITHSAQETRQAGMLLAAQLRPGDVLLMTGDLGAGKSELCRGIARGLGIGGPVPSPSFTILNRYEEGRLPFNHFDWYRVSGEDELLESGLDEILDEHSVSAIEWHERAPGLLPADCLDIRLKPLDGEQREIVFVPHGAFRALDWAAIGCAAGEEP